MTIGATTRLYSIERLVFELLQLLVVSFVVSEQLDIITIPFHYAILQIVPFH